MLIDKAEAVTKEDIRRVMLKRRREMSQEEIDEKSKRIAEVLLSLDFIQNSQTFMVYVNMPGEVRTERIIEDLLKAGKTVAVPVCIPKTVELLASEIKGLDELMPGHYGILEPRKELIRPVDPKILEVIIVPGIAFDIRGNRIGHGKGYYDRFLRKVPPFAKKVGLAFEFQVMPNVPVCHFDVPMDMIITENGIRK